MSFSIGSLTFDGSAVLAPLASVTSAPFRQVCLEHGCSYAVTEMVSSEALVRDVRGAIVRMDRAPSERVLAVQLFGADPATMARSAAIAVERAGAAIVDVNMGCPVRKILGVGAGVALMREPELAQSIVRAMVQACGDSAAVTVKMRAGWDDGSMNAPEIARRVVDAGARAITVHARTRDQVHSGSSRWDVVRQVKQTVGVTVVGNGGVKSAADAAAMMRDTGCDAVMIGRGALGNPWVFESIRSGQPRVPSIEERFAVIRRHLALYIEQFGERVAAREMRKHLCWYLRGLPGSAVVRASLQTMGSSGQMQEVIGSFEAALLRGDTRADPGDFKERAVEQGD
ncbi:MAG: tRNA dihydrouridine synthase DusB [Deltaproteobacteria bacterium]|nr:tRNA dihydrouridine synthase DusB [Deltaproteobacteria bacterium]